MNHRPKQLQDLIVESAVIPPNIHVDVESATEGGNRRLMLSDNPETLTDVTVPTEQATLWHDVVRTTTRTVKHRIFGWHYNKIGGPVKLGITVENKSNAVLEVRHMERALEIAPEDGNWIIDVGQSIAKSCLAGAMKRLKPVDRHKFGRGTALLEEFKLPEGSLAGFTYDFTVEYGEGHGTLDYVIRTVVSKNTQVDLRQIHTDALPPVPPPQAHPRGVWSFSETNARMPAYVVGQSANYRACATKKLDGDPPADLLFTGARSELGPALDNRGQFGTIYNATIPIVNDSDEVRTVRIYANPRGGAFAGSVRIGNHVYGIPLLRDNTKLCRLVDISVPPGRSSYVVSFMVAGSATTPLGLYVITL
ncbi:hypothetical protein [Paenibacillus sp. 1-18]|uniref:hypothetical protein n=1 Tax=Paenibacillus sp. 1-18 TaxID=1333846 RepID=UPI0004708DD7|nr:hypothetical protein [Paenibacillus sp. 1-18]